MKFKIDISKSKNKKTSKDFSEKEKDALFKFLEENGDDPLAIDFAMEWFNCSHMTITILTMQKMGNQ
jgi:hypothetical protein